MLFFHQADLAPHLLPLLGRPLNGRVPVALALPTLDVPVHFVEPTLFLLGVVTELTHIGLFLGLIDELEPTRLAYPVLFVTLLPERTPAPVTTAPSRLFKETHRAMEWRMARRGVGLMALKMYRRLTSMAERDMYRQQR